MTQTQVTEDQTEVTDVFDITTCPNCGASFEETIRLYQTLERPQVARLMMFEGNPDEIDWNDWEHEGGGEVTTGVECRSCNQELPRVFQIQFCDTFDLALYDVVYLPVGKVGRMELGARENSQQALKERLIARATAGLQENCAGADDFIRGFMQAVRALCNDDGASASPIESAINAVYDEVTK